MEITCPSGLRGRIRKLKVKEQGQLLARVGGGKGKRGNDDRMDGLLDACWEETLDPGPYRFPSGRPVWQDVITGDRYYVFLKIREATFGPEYEFRVQCSRCRTAFHWQLDLRDLEVKEMPEEGKRHLVNGEPFEVELPGGDLVRFHVPRGKHENAGRVNGLDRLSSAVLARLEQLGDATDRRQMADALGELGLDELDFLLEEMEKVDGGVETSFEVVCPECEWETSVVLPFDRTFFMPKAGRRATR